MERIAAAMGGLLFAIAIFGGVMVVRIVGRFLWALTLFLETVAVLLIAVAVGYVVYRILLGDSDDPRRT